MSDYDFRSSIEGNDIKFESFVLFFHIRYKESSTATQSIKVDFKVDWVVFHDINEYALDLSIKLVF